MSKSYFMVVPETWDEDRLIKAFNTISEAKLGEPLFFDTGVGALTHSRGAGVDMSRTKLALLKITMGEVNELD